MRPSNRLHSLYIRFSELCAIKSTVPCLSHEMFTWQDLETMINPSLTTEASFLISMKEEKSR